MVGEGRGAAVSEGGGRGAERKAGRGGAQEAVTLIYGVHAVREALSAGKRKPLALYATANALPRVAELADAAGLKPKLVEARELARRLGADAVHQGLLLEARPLPQRPLDDVAPEHGIVLALDQITDPHNVGAILRTAAAFAVDGDRHHRAAQPGISGALSPSRLRAALEHVPIVRSSISPARSTELSDHGYLRVGLDSRGAGKSRTIALRAPLALVLGAEGKGLRRLTRENCDALARLDMPGAIKSLNVSNACAVALSVVRRRLG